MARQPSKCRVWAGHSSVATVFDRYGHLFPGGEDPVMDSIDAAAASLDDPACENSPDEHE